MALTARMVAIDCAGPAGVAKFRTEATGYRVLHASTDDVVLAGAPGDGQQG